MELRLNNQGYEIENMSEQAREDFARQIAFNRDTAIGQLALLGYPADHPYEPKPVEPPQPSQRRLRAPETFEHRGIRLGH